MQICDGHSSGEVCYESRNCPACEIEDRLQKEIDNRDVEIADLKDQIAFLEEQANGQ